MQISKQRATGMKIIEIIYKILLCAEDKILFVDNDVLQMTMADVYTECIDSLMEWRLIE